MGWTGRAPALPASMLVGQSSKEHHAMSRKSNATAVTIGIDPGKNTLHLIGLDARGICCVTLDCSATHQP